jgi:hypothetical protein
MPQLQLTMHSIQATLTERFYAWEDARKLAERDPEIEVEQDTSTIIYIPEPNSAKRFYSLSGRENDEARGQLAMSILQYRQDIGIDEPSEEYQFMEEQAVDGMSSESLQFSLEGIENDEKKKKKKKALEQSTTPAP